MRGLGLYEETIDGITGPATRRAVITFQRRKGLRADGVAGPLTRRALGRRGRPALGSRPIRSGAQGRDVAAVQFLLSRRGFGPISLDGGFGPNTKAAVHRFQRAAGLTVDDVAGPATLTALRRRTVAAAGVGGPVAFLRPVAAPTTDGFGWVSGRRHTGLDFPAATGVPVGAAGRGVVSFAGWNTGGYGNLVVVKHRLGFETWYAHLSRVAVQRGQAVVGGTPVGAVGSTGRSTGPHLHFEARLFGSPIDPAPRLLTTVAASARSVTSARTRRRLTCRPNGDARITRDADPPRAREGRCP
ncbi:MAG: peptidoglycan DD-metalloendopeptidase family protein [Actinomycetota bacterium]|nr:peptidoglycan DD-metalloendopeptidase family protein [Actinomycetota bacterium]